ncbi:MAG: T9SS type A sorting domain-containing protein [Parvicellaceae bacterium]
MKRLILLFLIIPWLNYGQSWEKTFGGPGYDVGYSVLQTTDGGYVITGSIITDSLLNTQSVFLLKTDSNGDSLWTKAYEERDSQGFCVQPTTDGGVVISGSITPNSLINSQVGYLIKTDSNGDTLWTKMYSEFVSLLSVQQTTDGGYIIAGGGSNALYVCSKTDSNGDTLWTKNYGGYSVQQTTDGGYIIADSALIKLDSNGDILWSKPYRDGAGGYSLQQTTDGGYIVTGTTPSAVYLHKTDSNGDTLWTNSYSGGAWGCSVEQTSDGGYIISGATEFFTGIPDVYLLKTDSNGDSLWTKTYGASSGAVGYSIQQTTDGGYIITGSKRVSSTNVNVYFIKTDGSGNVLWTNEIALNSKINAFPNPTDDLIILDIEGYNGAVNVEVYDLTGKLLKTTKNTTISMGEYIKGIYVFKVAYNDKVEKLKVVKE